MKSYFSVAELAGLPGLPNTVRGINKKSKSEKWESQKRNGKGGGMEYHVESLPQETRAHLASLAASEELKAGQNVAQHVLLKEKMTSLQVQTAGEAGLIQSATVTGKAQQRMDAKITILNARSAFIQHSGLKTSHAHAQFCMRYNNGNIETEDWVRELIPSIHPATIYRWIDRIKKEGATGLSGHFGSRKGSSKIDTQPAFKDFITGMLRDYPHMSAALLYRSLQNRFKESDLDLPGKRAVERWITGWKKENHDIYLASTNPDAWKSKQMLAFGSYSDGLVRPNQRWELDGTPADILLVDGRYSITAVIDVFTRRAKMLVTKTAISAAVAQVMRKALLDWGVPETAKTDNGKDYISNHMKRVLVGLGIEQDLSAPFSPQEKPYVERFFGTFSRDLLELMPGFIGHSVADRQAIESRKAFSDRLFKKDQVTEIKMTAEQLQEFCDDWCENIYHHRAHSGLNGKTPHQTAAEHPEKPRKITNERALDLLLQPVAGDNGYRKIGKKGIKIGGIYYIATELGSWSVEHPDEKVLCIQDPDDFGRIMVYGENEFIAIARSDYEGVERQEVAIRAKEKQKQAVQEGKRALKQTAKKARTHEVAEEMLREKAEQSIITRLPVSENYTTPALDAAAEADFARRNQIQIDAGQLQQNQKSRTHSHEIFNQDKFEKDWPNPQGMHEVQLYRYSKQVKQRMDQGEQPPDYVMQFFTAFYEGETYQSIEKTQRELGCRHDRE